MNNSKVTVNCLVLLILLLFSSTAFSFPSSPEADLYPVESFISKADLQQNIVGLSEVSRSSVRILPQRGDLLPLVRNFRFSKVCETLIGSEYIRCSEAILPSLGIPAIIYPFHVFL